MLSFCRGLMGRTRGTREGRRTAHARQPTRTTSPTAHDRQTLRDMAEIPADPAEMRRRRTRWRHLEVNTLETELATVSEPSFSYIDDDANASFSVVNKRRRSRRVPNTTITKPERPDDILLYESVSKSNLATEIFGRGGPVVVQGLCSKFRFPHRLRYVPLLQGRRLKQFVCVHNKRNEKESAHIQNLPRVKKMASKAKKVREQKQNGWRRRKAARTEDVWRLRCE